jgi:hypothetical protein
MSNFAHLKRCLELRERDIVTAVAERAMCKELLQHLASISKPNDGGPKILLVYARMATTACDWIDGELRIEIMGDGEVSVVELMSELGGGLRERVLPSFGMSVPLVEFTRAVERVPHMIAPLTARSQTARRVVFSATEETRKTSMPPPIVEIGEASLFVVPSAPRMPAMGGSRGPTMPKGEPRIAIKPGFAAQKLGGPEHPTLDDMKAVSVDDLDDDWEPKK